MVAFSSILLVLLPVIVVVELSFLDSTSCRSNDFVNDVPVVIHFSPSHKNTVLSGKLLL